MIIAEGKISLREDEEAKILCASIIRFDADAFENPKGKLYLRLPSKDSEQTKTVKDILLKTKGASEVFLYYTDTKTYENLKIPQGSIRRYSPETERLEELLGKENVAFRAK